MGRSLFENVASQSVLLQRIMERVKNLIVNVTKGIKMTFVEIEESLKNEKL